MGEKWWSDLVQKADDAVSDAFDTASKAVDKYVTKPVNDAIDKYIWDTEDDEAWLESYINDAVGYAEDNLPPIIDDIIATIDALLGGSSQEATNATDETSILIEDALWNWYTDAEKDELWLEDYIDTLDLELEQEIIDIIRTTGYVGVNGEAPPGVSPVPPVVDPIFWLTDPLCLALRAIVDNVAFRLETFIATAFGIEREK